MKMTNENNNQENATERPADGPNIIPESESPLRLRCAPVVAMSDDLEAAKTAVGALLDHDEYVTLSEVDRAAFYIAHARKHPTGPTATEETLHLATPCPELEAPYCGDTSIEVRSAEGETPKRLDMEGPESELTTYDATKWNPLVTARPDGSIVLSPELLREALAMDRRSSEPTEDDRLRWATYAVEAGYAEWSETPGRTTATTEAYFTLFRILEREHRLSRTTKT